jgi:hypothetical protein
MHRIQTLYEFSVYSQWTPIGVGKHQAIRIQNQTWKRTPHLMTRDAIAWALNLGIKYKERNLPTKYQIRRSTIAMSLPFSTPPSAAKISLTPFKVAVPQVKLDELETLLKLAKFAPHTYENSQTDRRYGVGTDWLITMRDLWLRSYNWYCITRFSNSLCMRWTELMA